MSRDTEAIAVLIHRYAELIDVGDFGGVADLLGEATFRTAGRDTVRRGRDEVRAAFESLIVLYDGVPRTKHVVTNVVVEHEEASDAAAARSYFTVLQAVPELPLQTIIAGRYHDRFERRGGRWRFTDRLILVDLVGDLRYHLRGNPLD